jgi:radical SAM protein with 4Fe4S-binding SPASM domain
MADMTDETIEQVLDLIEKFGIPREAYKIVKGKNGQNVRVPIPTTQISFYGGEPILRFERVKKFIERSIERGMKLKFTALSNGTVGTPEIVNYLKYFNCWTQRSIDGHPEAQEKYRPNSIEAYKAQNEIWKDYPSSRRMTVQPEFAKDLLKSQHFFEEMGFWGGTSPMPNFYTEWTDEHIEDFKKSLWELGRYYVEMWKKGKPFYNYYFSNELSARYQNQKKFGCGFARGLHCVSWDGYLYVCHRFSKSPTDGQFCAGHIKDVIDGTAKGYGEEVLKRAVQYQHNKREDWNPECLECPANAGCEKGCAHTNWECTGTLNKPPKLYCEIRKETAKIVTWMEEQLRPLDAQWWTKGNTVKKTSGGRPCQINCGIN